MIKRILKTDLLYTSVGNPIPNGMLAIDQNNRIVEVGENLNAKGVEEEYLEGALCPGFVNTHCHLELSHLKGQVKKATGLTGFIQDLQKIRSSEESTIAKAIENGDDEMRASGIIAVGDICNGDATFKRKENSSIYYHSFVELFGFDPKKAEPIYERGIELKEKANLHQLSSSLIPHSPYSVSKKLFNLISETQNNTPLSIHNQETASENELYQSGKGKMAEMLAAYGNNINDFEITKSNSLPAYLKLLPSNRKLLLVHNTFTTTEDIDTAEQLNSNLYWCFCPKANLYIEGRLPDIPQFIKAGVKCTLGTDSLASNDSLSIWKEIKSIQQHFPEIELNTLIQWATINGAEFLGIESDFGSFEVGKKATVNWIKSGTEASTELQPISL